MTPLTFCLALAACVALGFIIIVSPDIHRAIRKRKARRLHERAQQAGALSSYEIAAEQLVWRLGAVDRIRLLRERE